MTRTDVEEFLRRTFPSAVGINVLRGPLPTSHKGHAYVHFVTEESALQESMRIESGGGLFWSPHEREMEGEENTKVTVLLKVQPVKTDSSSPVLQSVSSAEKGKSKDPTIASDSSFSSASLISAWENVPLPPHVIAYSYLQCAYGTKKAERKKDLHHRHHFSTSLRFADESGASERIEEDREEKKNGSSCPSSDLSSGIMEDRKSPSVLTVLPFSTEERSFLSDLDEIVVVVFCSASERDKAVNGYPALYTRCGPPSLEFLLACPPHATWTNVTHSGSPCLQCDSDPLSNSMETEKGKNESNSYTPVWVGRCTAKEYFKMWEKSCEASRSGKRQRSSSTPTDIAIIDRKTERCHDYSCRKTAAGTSARKCKDEKERYRYPMALPESEGALTSVSPVEALADLSEFLEGKGRVAVKDLYGNITIFRLPMYVSDFV